MSVCRILVVDDHRDSTDSMAMLLQMMGHEVQSAYDGFTAIRLAKEFQPDIVLLNLAMPGLDGLAAARAIRKTEAGHLIHLVAVTGWGRKEDEELTRHAGFDAHLLKPVDIKALEGMLAHYCEQSHRKRESCPVPPVQ
jgi:CheY-like chemotaxis protein